MKQVLVARRKGRVPGAIVGAALLGPLGFLAGGALGTRTEITLEEKPTLQDKIAAAKAEDAARPPSTTGKYFGLFCLFLFVIFPIVAGALAAILKLLGL
jgi:hypothetical protein